MMDDKVICDVINDIDSNYGLKDVILFEKGRGGELSDENVKRNPDRESKQNNNETNGAIEPRESQQNNDETDRPIEPRESEQNIGETDGPIEPRESEQNNGETDRPIVPRESEQYNGETDRPIEPRESEQNNGETDGPIEPRESEQNNGETDRPIEPRESEQNIDEMDGHIEPLVVQKVAGRYQTQISMTDKIAPNATKVTHAARPSVMDATDTGQEETNPSEKDAVTKVQVDKRKSGKLKINGGVDFCEIVTVCYREEQKKTKQHYVQEIKGQVDGDIGLLPLDELIMVNNHKLTNKSQSDVKNIFRDIKLDKKTHSLKLALMVRRWKKDPSSTEDDPVWTEVWEIDYELVLGIEDQIEKTRAARILAKLRHKRLDRRMSVKRNNENIRSKVDLHEGNIEVERIERHYTGHIEYMANDTGSDHYLHMSSDGLLSCGVLRTENSAIFTAEPFLGIDTGPKPFTLDVICVRYYAQRSGSKWFLCYDEDKDVQCELHDDDEIKTDSIDKRCFIKRGLGHKQLLQSALDRDLFMWYDTDTSTFKMKDIGSRYLIGLDNQEKDSYDKFCGCWFQYFPENCTESIHTWNNTASNGFDLIKFFSCGVLGSSRPETHDRGRRPMVRR